jgi:hypothetical protein
VSVKSNDTTLQILGTKHNNKNPEYNRSRVYKLTCKTCQHTYIGQASRNLKRQYQHIRYLRSNNPQSAYTQHILNNRHEYGTIEDIMKLIKPTTHTSLFIPYEALFIQLHQQQGHLITEQTTSEPNPLFQLHIETTQTHLINWSIQTHHQMPVSHKTAVQTDINTSMYHKIHNITHCITKNEWIWQLVHTQYKNLK